MPALSVHLNRDRPRDIDAPASYVADGPFDVALENHGAGSHVHLKLDTSLSRAARLRDDSRYIDAETTTRIGVDTQPMSEPVTGELTISAGYGAETETVELRIEPSRAGGYGIDVDETLAQPQSAESVLDRLDAETIGLLALAALTLTVAVAVAVLVQSGVVIAAAAFVALVTVVGLVLALT
ncbi:hypothetical protein SY89_01387 [Halolamina pelagica]|uniref:Uncharacterized protein n=1 Tax=Halolamina pelagica TaxID=699431 RepID=A0A0N8HZW6_9EURY|nr:hypothetical protein [Halolamina pelagica]KPN30651.1 hypothetical protein SY89_01387 [Halolamina pelagica]